MSLNRTRISAAVTLLALGALTAVALGARGDGTPEGEPAAASAPEVRTEIVRRTVRVPARNGRGATSAPAPVRSAGAAPPAAPAAAAQAPPQTTAAPPATTSFGDHDDDDHGRGRGRGRGRGGDHDRDDRSDDSDHDDDDDREDDRDDHD